ncbi:Histone acetyltransferase type B subunit 2 [Cucumispora dikerogammari]|nr:Histone acetyltransferase type B subunit 2 [Cucumispora dikerogammari]
MDDSSSKEQHIIDLDSTSLEVDEKAYSLLENIQLEWPSQTVCFLNTETLLLGTNPDDLNIKEATLYSFDFSNTQDYTRLDDFIPTKLCSAFINRIRTFSILERMNNSKNLFVANSDASIFIFFNNQLSYKLDVFNDYGLAIDSEKVCFSEKGVIQALDLETHKIVKTKKIHEKNINDIILESNLILTASDDFTFKLFDVRSNETVFTECFGVDVNAIDSNRQNKVVCGLESGEIHLFDMRSQKKENVYRWHKSAVSSLKFYSNYEFYSTSFEKCCLWDLDLEEIEDWKYPNELVFEHSGDKQYKDMSINNNSDERVFAASGENGICLFSPIG